MSRSYIEIDIEEYLSDIDDDVLEQEWLSRKKSVPSAPHLMQIYEAMLTGSKDRAWELMRQYVQEETGRVLP